MVSDFLGWLKGKKKFGWIDVLVIIFVFALIYGIMHVGIGLRVPFSKANQPQIDLNPIRLPYYVGRSLLRMFLAFFVSLLFTFVYGRIAASSRLAEKIMIPIIDILQSVPVLGFLSATVTFFISLFPGSLLGVELASIFAIFTGQAWNMTFSFYHSLSTIPRDLQEATKIYGFNSWNRFKKLEVPYSMIGLVWNSMMSFGGGWFFLSVSEAITVLGTNIRLPGIGSYIATAIDEGNVRALMYAIFAMILTIVLVDQFFWRPIVAWAQKYKMELTESNVRPTSWVLDILQRSIVVNWFTHYVLKPVWGIFDKTIDLLSSKNERTKDRTRFITPYIQFALMALVLFYLARYVYMGAQEVSHLGIREMGWVVWLGFLTMLRVTAAIIIGGLWTIPVGVAIGFSPRLSRIFQPIVQIASSFPANMTFPVLTILYLKLHINFEIGSIPLMMLGTQWYILFNVIAGAMAIPTDLKEASDIFALSRWEKWKKLIIPGIFPQLVTGGITAMGGAWNASIVSEIVSWKHSTLIATGLGAYIAQATNSGNWAGIIWGIFVMSMFVVLINRLFWRRLYKLAEEKYHIE
jgi:NitT/TauT family transport system permease protein